MKKLSFLVLVLFMGSLLMAQSEEPKPTKHNATWHRVVFVEYKAGKVDDAKQLISHFASASSDAGSNMPQLFWFETGPYDMMLLWDLKGGPSDLEWSWSPDGVSWWKAFVAQEGSAEAANKIQDDYDKLVASSTSQLLRKDK